MAAGTFGLAEVATDDDLGAGEVVDGSAEDGAGSHVGEVDHPAAAVEVHSHHHAALAREESLRLGVLAQRQVDAVNSGGCAQRKTLLKPPLMFALNVGTGDPK